MKPMLRRQHRIWLSVCRHFQSQGSNKLLDAGIFVDVGDNAQLTVVWAAKAWFEENDSKGVAPEYDVIDTKTARPRTLDEQESAVRHRARGDCGWPDSNADGDP
jgi:hypothetical protein